MSFSAISGLARLTSNKSLEIIDNVFTMSPNTRLRSPRSIQAKACSPGRVREPWDRAGVHALSPRSERQKLRNRGLLVAVAHCVGSPYSSRTPIQGSRTRPGLQCSRPLRGLICPNSIDKLKFVGHLFGEILTRLRCNLYVSPSERRNEDALIPAP